MIHTITTHAIFPASGATLTGEFQPGSGITAVVGENGAGKTFMSIEAVRWLLYGKAALRGAAPDYRQAEVVGEVSIGGARYKISRGRSEWVKDASGEMVAKGAEQVTAYVTAAMGYGLDVFDLCNAATQGNVQRLGKMRPAERKAIIDKVLRLTDAERAEKDCREEAKGLRREVDALTKALRAPGDEPPVVAADSIDRMRATIAEARERRAQLTALGSRRRNVERPALPVVDHFDEAEIVELERHERRRQEDAGARRHLEMVSSAWDLTAEQIDAAEQRAAVRAAIEARGPRPMISPEAIAEDWARHHAADAHRASDEVTCPKCDHTFRPTGEAPAAPLWSKDRLRHEERWNEAWSTPAPVIPDGLDLNAGELRVARNALEARQTLASLGVALDDRSEALASQRAAQAKMDAFLAAQLQFERADAANAFLDGEIEALGRVASQTEIDVMVDEANTAGRAHDIRLAWEREDAAFKDAQARIVETSRMAEEYKKGADGIADARAVVKAMIAPKISLIATALIRDMSAGKLDSLVVDEEMEITVAGQRIETLSGAGETVANLALRIAMGQALVGRVFPVFLADEIDGDLSAKRREATLQSLVSLKKHLQQIILVTHRGADVADAVWDVSQ